MSNQDIANADKIMKAPAPTITDFIAPNSKGSVNDYYSDASYWWPDPSKADGLPYIRREKRSIFRIVSELT